MTRFATVVMLALCACNMVFGLEPPLAANDANVDTDSAIDADDGDAVSFPDAPVDSAIDSPIDSAVDAPPLPIDAPGCIACIPTIDSNECTLDVCCNGITTHPPANRDTYCNGGADQCDGLGNCVDCTTSGGCGECCVCFNQACIPA